MTPEPGQRRAGDFCLGLSGCWVCRWPHGLQDGVQAFKDGLTVHQTSAPLSLSSVLLYWLLPQPGGFWESIPSHTAQDSLWEPHAWKLPLSMGSSEEPCLSPAQALVETLGVLIDAPESGTDHTDPGVLKSAQNQIGLALVSHRLTEMMDSLQPPSF